MEAIVEFHAFKDNNNRFIVKELAIVSNSFQCQVLFESPYDKSNLNDKMQRTTRWLTRHFHGIRWEDGTVPYNENLIRTLCKPFSIIHTKGLEKVKFLKEFHFDVREITGKPEGEQADVVCLLPQHRGCTSKCALHSAKLYYNHIQSNL